MTDCIGDRSIEPCHLSAGVDPRDTTLDDIHAHLELDNPTGPEVARLRDCLAEVGTQTAQHAIDLCNDRLLLLMPQSCMICGHLAEAGRVTCPGHTSELRQEWEDWARS